MRRQRPDSRRWPPNEERQQWNINVTSRVITRKTDPPGAGQLVPKSTRTGTDDRGGLSRDKALTVNRPALWQTYINGTNILTKFHENWAINVASKIFYCRHLMKNAPPPGGHVFLSTGTTFELSRAIIRTNVVTHEDWTIHFELDQDIIRAKLCTKFHEDQTINVASRVLTSQNVDDARRTKGDPKISGEL
ncbi:hypothetical protein DPMN_140145 [Dreissena polymorpha]|uniref:Uncharacterized protein n=1 Tax=Dreissena polymorpha TaxID=45954 RepID=A0A9D4JH57_DREPO|nr:hypothetical protein DPMN_140145 [Dreissena polymorpha]